MYSLAKKNPIYLLLLLLCGVVIIYGCSDKTESVAVEQDYAIDKPYYAEAMRLNVKVSSDQINISGLITMELSLEIKPGYEASFPAVSEILKQFKIRTWNEESPKLGDGGKILKVHRYKLEPLEIGECEIPALTFEFKQKDSTNPESETKTLSTEPIIINITTSLPADMQELVIMDIEDVVELKADRTLLWVVVGSTVLLIAGIVIVIAVKPKKAVQIKRIYKSAHQIAFEMLKSIASKNLVEQGMVKEFYEKLSNCLRQYIENRFSLKAPEQTTEEFLEQLKHSNELKLEHKNELKKFLEHCDLVKFAKYAPTNEQITDSLSMAERFVVKTMSDQFKVDVTEENAEVSDK